MSIAKVAKIAGVSSTTVSFIINNKPGISPATVSRVKAAMREIGYVPKSSRTRNDSHGELAGLRTGNIGVVMGENAISTLPFYAKLFESIHIVLDEKNLTIVPVRMSKQGPISNASVEDLDGIILCSYSKELAKNLLMPFISVLGHPATEDRLDADHIEPADDRIGAMAAKYLINRGHKNILAVNPAASFHPAFTTRVHSFFNTAQKRGVEVDLKEVPFIERDETSRLNDGNEIESVQKFIAEYKAMPNKATGLFIPSDSHLVVIQKSFQSAGIKPGQDVELLGCNNEILLGALEVRPATIDINPMEIAKAAVNVLLQRISEYEIEEKVPFYVVNIEPTIIEAGAGVKASW